MLLQWVLLQRVLFFAMAPSKEVPAPAQPSWQHSRCTKTFPDDGGVRKYVYGTQSISGPCSSMKARSCKNWLWEEVAQLTPEQQNDFSGSCDSGDDKNSLLSKIAELKVCNETRHTDLKRKRGACENCTPFSTESSRTQG